MTITHHPHDFPELRSIITALQVKKDPAAGYRKGIGLFTKDAHTNCDAGYDLRQTIREDA